MAGSWAHIATKNGKFRGTQLIENLGDAHEALEECFGMIWWLAEAHARATVAAGMPPGRDQILAVIRQAEENSGAGKAMSRHAGRDPVAGE